MLYAVIAVPRAVTHPATLDQSRKAQSAFGRKIDGPPKHHRALRTIPEVNASEIAAAARQTFMASAQIRALVSGPVATVSPNILIFDSRCIENISPSNVIKSA